MKSVITICLLFNICVASSGQNLKKNWRKVLKGCGQSEIMGNNVLFFGASNVIGPGSVWRKTESNGYANRFELGDMVKDTDQLRRIIIKGAPSKECSASKNVTWAAGVALPFLSNIFGGNGVDANLHRSRRATVSVDNIAMDIIRELTFETTVKDIKKSDSSNIYVNDLLNIPDRLVMTKAYRITGMVVKMDFDPKVLEELKQKYANGASIKLGGDQGVNVEFNYNSESQLTLKLPTDVYIGGEFSRISTSGAIQMESEEQFRVKLVPVAVVDNAKILPVEHLK